MRLPPGQDTRIIVCMKSTTRSQTDINKNFGRYLYSRYSAGAHRTFCMHGGGIKTGMPSRKIVAY